MGGSSPRGRGPPMVRDGIARHMPHSLSVAAGTRKCSRVPRISMRNVGVNPSVSLPRTRQPSRHVCTHRKTLSLADARDGVAAFAAMTRGSLNSATHTNTVPGARYPGQAIGTGCRTNRAQFSMRSGYGARGTEWRTGTRKCSSPRDPERETSA